MRRKAIRIKDIPENVVAHLSKKRARVNPTFGCDPEFFIIDNKMQVMASDKFFPGKDKPLRFDGNALFFDGIQAELNVSPSVCRESLASNIRTALKKARHIINKKSNDKTQYSIITQPTVRVKQRVLNNADPEARRFGCEPDFNAYTLGQNTPEMDASHHLYRYAGGHIHIGCSPYNKISNEYKLAKTEEGHIRAIKFMDYITGAILVLLDRGVYAKRRRSKYGTAGCFRPTPYGIEYRTPSCWWLSSPMTMSLVFGLIKTAWFILRHDLDNDFIKLVGYSQDDVRGIVDESDVSEAKKFWKALRPYLSIVGPSVDNPLHILSGHKIRGIAYYTNFYTKAKKNEINETITNSIYALPAFEYVIKHGVKALHLEDISKEWSLTNIDRFYNRNGFINGTHHKFAKNKDFMKFQQAFFAKII